MESLSPTGSRRGSLTQGFPIRGPISQPSTPESLYGLGLRFEESYETPYGVFPLSHQDACCKEIQIFPNKPSADYSYHLDVKQLCRDRQAFDDERFVSPTHQFLLSDERCISTSALKAIGPSWFAKILERTMVLKRFPFRMKPGKTANNMEDMGLARYHKTQLTEASSCQSPSQSFEGPPDDLGSQGVASDDEDASPLLSSLRRMHPADAASSAEDVIASFHALSKHEAPSAVSACDQPATDALESISTVPADQGSAADGSPTCSNGTQAQTNQPKMRKKTSGRQFTDENDDYGSDEDEEGRDELNSHGAATQQQKTKLKKSWQCPYGVKYPNIDNLASFKACRQHGIKGRDQFWAHLRLKHYEESRNRHHPRAYKMSRAQQLEIDVVVKNTHRVWPSKHNEEAQVKVDRDAYHAVWSIIFPGQLDQCPHLPYFLNFSMDEVKQISQQAFDAYMRVRRQEHSRAEDHTRQSTVEEDKKDFMQALSDVLVRQAAGLHNGSGLGKEDEGIGSTPTVPVHCE